MGHTSGGISGWIRAFASVILVIVGLIAYGSGRPYVLALLANNEYRLGFCEGIATTVFFFYLADKYAVPELMEFIQGVRVIGRADSVDIQIVGRGEEIMERLDELKELKREGLKNA